MSDLPQSDEDGAAPERTPPERIGRYELRFELASGGMGSVYLARLRGTAGFDKLVALKRIHPHLARDKRYINMFLDEAKIASRITHPNVCSVFDSGHVSDDYFLAMEYLVGEPLSRVLARIAASQTERRDSLLPLRVARIFADACEGLHAAHELRDPNGDLLRVVHRDVTPRNLFLTYDGTVQVVDFGLASARERLHHTETGEMKGTFSYMAPEQIQTGTVDRRVDIWGLGVAMWEMLAVKRLFKRDNTANTMFSVLYDDIQAPSELRLQVPKELDEITLKALARDPAERWQTAREMGQALRRFLSNTHQLVGPAELSDWMARLFPAGEARKRQLMELARLAPAPVLSIPVNNNEFDITQVAGLGASIPPAAKPSRVRRALMGFAAGLLLSAAALAVFLYQSQASEPIADQPSPPETVDLSQQTTEGFDAARVAPEPTVAQTAKRADDRTAPEGGADDETVPKGEADDVPTPQAEANDGKTPNGEAAAPAPDVRKRSGKSRTRKASTKSTVPGTVNLVTRGGWAQVFKDGRSLGTTPLRLTLPPGRHKLVLKPSGGQTSKRIFIRVESGRTKQVSIPLK